MSETRIPKSWKKTSAWVYSPSKAGSISKKKSEPIQGVWATEIDGTSPQEVWLFTNADAPASIKKEHKNGVWGYKPGVNPGNRGPDSMLFYPPNSTIPKKFSPEGVWLLPLFSLQGGIDKLEPGGAGFVKVGNVRDKDKKCDVSGQWNMIYRRDDLEPVPMKIFVKTLDGKTLTLNVKSNDTIESVKDKVKQKEGIDKADQRLGFGSKELEDGLILEEYNIKDGDTLHLLPMQIHIKDSKGKTFTTTVTANEKIDSVKEKIFKKAGIPKNYQNLTFKNKELVDQQTLKNQNVKHGSTLDLKPIQINVKKPNGPSFVLDVDPRDTVESIKDQIEEKKGIPKDEQRLSHMGKELKETRTIEESKIEHQDTLVLESTQICVRDLDGKKFVLDVDPNDTIDKIMDKIEKETGLPKDEQRLAFKNEELLRRNTLKECNIKHGDTIDLVPMQVQIKDTNGEKFTIDVRKDDQIQIMKKKIEKITKIPPDEQFLEFNLKELIDCTKTLKECQVNHGDTLNLVPMQIQVREPNEDIFSVNVNPNDTIEKVQETIEKKTGIPKDVQHLIFKNEELLQHRTVKECNIKHKDNVDLETMKVRVKSPDGTIHQIETTPKDTIDDLKEKITEKTGISEDEQRLVKDDKELTNTNKTLKDYNIKHQDLLEVKPTQVNFRKPNGETFTMDVNVDDTVETIKKKIEQTKGIPFEDQRLVHRKEVLENHRTLKTCNITHGNTIDIEAPQIEVQVKEPNGNVHSVNVRPDDTVDTLKEKIELTTQIQKEDQRLVCNGQDINDDKKTLEDYDIRDGDAIDMKPAQITLTDKNGETVTIEVELNETVETFMTIVEEKTGIPAREQRIVYRKEELVRRRTLRYHHISDGDTVDLLPMQIQVVDPNGKTHCLEVNGTDTIDSIKQKLEAKTGIPKGDIELEFNSMHLHGSNTLRSYNIGNGDTLHFGSMSIVVRVADGSTFSVAVRQVETIDSVKNKIQQMKEVPKEHQRLSCRGSELKDSSTIQDNNIKNKEIIDLATPTYQIDMTEWQNPMAAGYDPKPRVQHEGKRDLSNIYAYLNEGKDGKENK